MCTEYIYIYIGIHINYYAYVCVKKLRVKHVIVGWSYIINKLRKKKTYYIIYYIYVL